ncbi:MAG: helix-turn-helix transcriptional regulator [Acidimicrobiales bacterium]|nr:helix-turn-helix transcriptional regulator [Acidimicrobiales bacterium]
MPASSFLHAARTSRGWSQRELARRCGVAQPSLSDIETGDRDTTVAKLEQILRATGHRLVSIPTTRPTVAEWALALRDEADRPAVVNKSLVEFSNDLRGAEPTTAIALTIAAPETTNDQRVDAALAAIVDHSLVQRGLPTPTWVDEPSRFSSVEWDLIEHPDLRLAARATVPRAFARRNVYIPREFFDSV